MKTVISNIHNKRGEKVVNKTFERKALKGKFRIVLSGRIEGHMDQNTLKDVTKTLTVLSMIPKVSTRKLMLKVYDDEGNHITREKMKIKLTQSI